MRSILRKPFTALRPLNSTLKSSLRIPRTVPTRRNCSICSNLRAFPALTIGHHPATLAMSTVVKPDPFASNRLPTTVTPSHYDLTVKIDLEKLSFEGKVEIDITVNKSTDTIVLHALEPLKVHSAALTSSALKTESHLVAKSFEISKEAETLTCVFPTSLQEGTKAKLGFTFTAPLDNSMMGCYRSAHKPDKDSDKTEYYCLTQFEPTGARKAFPCWDEPAIKATYAITLIHRPDTVALSNMNDVDSQKSDGAIQDLLSVAELKSEKGPATDVSGSGWLATKFATTPKISTYLVAYANGKFESISSEYKSPLTGKKVPVRVFATRECIHQCELTLEATARIVPVYEKIFDIPYPLPKLDTLVAADFDAGAMENWGLITGRTSIYLFDPNTSGLAARKLTVAVQAHEIAHQWFGNIVTQYNNSFYIKLNEAFATLMGEVISIEELHPEWKPHTDFLNAHLVRALQLDALRSSHPIEMPCPDSKMINQIFDGISYSKGASVLKMLATSVGEKTFLKGVSIYLKKHLYANSQTKDLWAGITEASGLDVAKVMANWTLKTGFPVVTVEETADGLKLRQNRFLSTADVKPEDDETLWWIPLQLKTVNGGKSSVDSKLYLEERESTISLENSSSAIYKLNAETSGVYRVSYPASTLSRLGKEAGKPDSAFSVNDRIGLVSDAITLAKAGSGKTSGALAFIKELQNEKASEVWSAIASAVASIKSVWWEQDQKVIDGIDRFSAKLFGPLAAELGFDPSEQEDPSTRELRTTVIAAALGAKEPKTLEEARKRFAKYVETQDESAISGDVRNAVFVSVSQNGGEKEFEALLKIYKNPPSPQHKSACMLALANPGTLELQKRGLQMMLSEEVKTQDIMYFAIGASKWGQTRRLFWEFFQENFALIEKRFAGNFSVQRVIQSSFASLTSDKDLESVQAFFKDRDTTTYQQVLDQGLDAVRSNAGWLSRDKDDVAQWLAAN